MGTDNADTITGSAGDDTINGGQADTKWRAGVIFFFYAKNR
ncbi:MAG: hypothetical protein H0A76_05715 [Candidatus Thiodubiliella endoseptemdiera]|uniref:Uncharacterized protein n=1 Tax=Candidatus Thiodubiliella endoseptemdiera TaxID=2738886 RepID=A0A853F6R5_9GAMM|nr:hypothetical protein [Candidatus Thiodubiliella endoseptemdiera]